MKDSALSQVRPRVLRVARVEFEGGVHKGSGPIARVFLSDGSELGGLSWVEAELGVFKGGEVKIHAVMQVEPGA